MTEIFHLQAEGVAAENSALIVGQRLSQEKLIQLLEATPQITEGPLFFIHQVTISDEMVLLLAIDVDGQLVIIGILAGETTYSMFQDLWDAIWSFCIMSYGEIQQLTHSFLREKGKEIGDLAVCHQTTFSLEAPLHHIDFNKRQRLFFVSSHFSETLLQRIGRISFFIDTRVVELRYSSSHRGKAVLTVEKTAPDWKLRLQGFANWSSDLFQSLQESPWWCALSKRVMDLLNRLALRGLVQQRITAFLLLFLILGYGALFSFLTVRQHLYFGTFGFDLGLYDQGLWLLSQGKTPFVTIAGQHLFERDYSYIMALISPLYWLWDDVRALLIFQSFILALGALPLYWLAKQAIGNVWLAVLFPIVYLLYPALEWQNYWHFHPASLATTFLLYCFYFGIKGRLYPFCFFLLLSLMCVEQVIWVGILLGILLMALKQGRLGLFATILSVAWLFLSSKLLPIFGIPALSSQLGQVSLLFQPQKLLSSVLNSETWVYLIQILVPLAFLPLMNLKMLLPALVPLLENLNHGGYQLTVRYHYLALIIPFLFLSTLYASAQIIKRSPITTFSLSSILLISALLSHIFLSPSPIAKSPPWVSSPPPQYAMIQQAMDLIPPQAVVSVHYTFSPHLTHREQVYEFPNPWRLTNWQVAEKAPRDPDVVEYLLLDDRVWSDDDRKLIDTLVQEGRYETIFNQDHIVFMKRKR